MTRLRALVTGARGQLGRELIATLPDGVDAVGLSRAELDIASPEAVATRLDAIRPEVVINTAAYTAVDDAEAEGELARAANADGPRLLADACRASGARMIQVSTDFVFDGEGRRAYAPDDPVAPLGVYGRTKLAGERAVRELLPEASLIVRTSWLYSAHGKNFVTTMLRLFASQPVVRVVNDQLGSPTWTGTLAAAIWRWAARPAAVGVRHWCDRGETSWHGFAAAVRDLGIELGLLTDPGELLAIASEEFPTAARRPRFSVLDANASARELALPRQDWRESLRLMLTTLAEPSSG